MPYVRITNNTPPKPRAYAVPAAIFGEMESAVTQFVARKFRPTPWQLHKLAVRMSLHPKDQRR